MMREKVWLVAGTVISALSLSGCNRSADDKYETCLNEASKVKTAVGVNTAAAACHMTYQRENREQVKEELQKQSATISNVYWDGWEFRKGELPDGFNGKGYRIYTFARYGVVTCEAAMPEEMGKELGDIGDKIDPPNNPQHYQLWQACFEAR